MSAKVKEPIAFQSLRCKCDAAVGLRHDCDFGYAVSSCIRLRAFKIYEYYMKVPCMLFPEDILTNMTCANSCARLACMLCKCFEDVSCAIFLSVALFTKKHILRFMGALRPFSKIVLQRGDDIDSTQGLQNSIVPRYMINDQVHRLKR